MIPKLRISCEEFCEDLLKECPANKGVPEIIAPENAGNLSRECPISKRAADLN